MVVWIIAGLFALLSVPLLLGKGGFLIAGFNTSSAEEKAKYNEKKLSRTMGVMCLAIAVLTAILGWVNTEEFAVIYIVLLALVIAATLYYANKKCGR